MKMKIFALLAIVLMTTVCTPAWGAATLPTKIQAINVVPGNNPNHKYALKGRTAVNFPVPYFTPTAADTAIALDIFPKGDAVDVSATTGTAYIDLCSTDVEPALVPYDCLRMGKFRDGNGHVSTAHGVGGTNKNLTLQLLGGNVGIGTLDADYALTVNSDGNTGIAVRSDDVDHIFMGYSDTGGSWFSGAATGEYALRGMGGKINIGSNTTTPLPTLEILPGNPGSVQTRGALVLALSDQSAKMHIASSATTGSWFSGTAIGDHNLRGTGGKINIGSYASTPAPTLSVTPGNTGRVLIGNPSDDGLTRLQIAGGVSIAGGIVLPVSAVTTDYTALQSDYTIKVNATGGNRTITLPPAASNTGRIYIIKKTDASANTVIIDGNGSETIDGAATKVLSAQNEVVTIQSDSANWIIVGL